MNIRALMLFLLSVSLVQSQAWSAVDDGLERDLQELPAVEQPLADADLEIAETQNPAELDVEDGEIESGSLTQENIQSENENDSDWRGL